MRVTKIEQFKKLKPRCRIWKEENIEWNYGIEFYIYSPFTRKWYKYEFGEHTDLQNLEDYIKDDTVFIEPDEEDKEFANKLR